MLLKLNFFILFFFLPLSLRGQEEEVIETPKNVKVKDLPDTEDLESQMEQIRNENQALIKQLESLSPEQKEDFQKAVQSGNMIEAGKMLEQFGVSAINPQNGQKSTGMETLVNMSLQSFRTMGRDDLRTHLQERLNRTPLGAHFKNSPRFQNFALNSLQDEKALPSFFSIIGQRQKLMIYLGVYLVTMLIAWLIKRNGKDVDRPLFERMAGWFLRFSGVWAVRITAFVLLFHKEAGPLWKIIWASI